MSRPAPAPGERRFDRVRRPADLLLGILAIAVVITIVGAIRELSLGSAELSADVSRFVLHIPRWLSFAAGVIAGIGCFALTVVALVELLRDERRGALNAAVGLLCASAIAIAAASIWHAENGAVARAILHGRNPTMFVVDAAYIAFLVDSDLVRRSRWGKWCVASAAALLATTLAVDTITPFALALALSGGLAVGWVIRWLLGAASVRPSTEQLIGWFAEHGLDVASLQLLDTHHHDRLSGELADGTTIEVRIASRDTRGLGLARRVWALVRLRPVVAGHAALSTRTRIEQLALCCYLAQAADVLSPKVLLLNETASESLVLAFGFPKGVERATTTSLKHPGSAKALFSALRALHEQGVAHRDLRVAHLLVDGDSGGFSSFESSVPGASDVARRLDVTQLLTVLAQVIDPKEAVEGLRGGYGPTDETAVAASLQPIALAPWGWSAMRAATPCLNQVRHELIGDADNPPIARLERFRWRTVVSAVGLTVAAYLFIGQLGKVNLIGALDHTNLGWFSIALLGSALTYLAAAENLAAFVPKRLSPVRGFFVQLATAFVGVAMPPTVGHVAVNARYLTRQRVDEASIAAAVALSQVINVATTVVLLVAIGLLTGSGLSRFHIVPGPDLLIGILAIVVAVGVLLAIPATRSKINRSVWPKLQSFWPRLLDTLAQPLRLVAGVGTSLLLSFSYLLAFIASLRALGAHPALLPAAAVYLAGNAVGSAAPTPGGLGAVEAVLAAGLTAMGIPAHQAIPAVLVFRIATFWIPIPAGWCSYLVLQRRGTL